MRRPFIAVALAGALLTGWALPTAAQQNGIVIQNNGVDSTDSAAGADNVRISNNPGNAQGSSGGGVNNETLRADRAPRERDRKDRGARNSGEAAPVENAPVEAAPAEGDLQAFSEGEQYVDPAAAPAAVADPAEAESVTLQLPNTGTGVENGMPVLAALAGMAALMSGVTSLKRRLIG
ncbi:MAG: LPXTG cell wall anchor domain-containing protein [Thermomicrobiales bacterium]